MITEEKKDSTILENMKIGVLPAPKELLTGYYQDQPIIKQMKHHEKDENSLDVIKGRDHKLWLLIESVLESEEAKEIEPQHF